MTYGAETLTLTRASAEKLRIAQRKMERSMLGKIRSCSEDRCLQKNESGRHNNKNCETEVVVCSLRTDDRWRRRLLDWRPRNDKRSAGRPPTRWRDDIILQYFNEYFDLTAILRVRLD